VTVTTTVATLAAVAALTTVAAFAAVALFLAMALFLAVALVVAMALFLAVAFVVAMALFLATVTAMTAVAAMRPMAGVGRCLTAHQGDPNDREKDRDPESQRTVHPLVLQ